MLNSITFQFQEKEKKEIINIFIMMINFGSLVHKNYARKKERKKIFSFFFFLSFDPIEKKKSFFSFFLSRIV